MPDNTKTYDLSRPFQRINSPDFKEGNLPANLARARDGDGHRRGTRRSGDGQPPLGALDGLLMAAVPSWVPVDIEPGDSYVEAVVETRNEKELYGELDRSFETWTDFPIWQWHRWYDWNFHIKLPANQGGYWYLRGEGNFGPTMECEWDTGAFGRRRRSSPMFHADWAWPMTGDWVWLIGRWIYDGGHEERGRTRSELHPCKAVATARLEGFKFPENDKAVPAVQFMFFSSTRGGYHNYRDMRPYHGGDYEFVVDLPPGGGAGGAPGPYAVGRTPSFPLNTVALRSDLLVHMSFAPFWAEAAGTAPFASGATDDAQIQPPDNLKPIVELIEPLDPSKPQAKITIPASAFPTDADFYGVIISLGWHDPGGAQAANVKKVTVRLDHLRKGTINHDTFKEEWNVRIGMNGRWRQWAIRRVSNNTSYSPGDGHTRDTLAKPEWEFFLPEDGEVRVSVGGAELDLVDDVIDNRRSEREIPNPMGSGPAVWNRDVDVRPVAGNAANQFEGAHRRQTRVAGELFSRTWWTVGDENDRLGLVDIGKNGAGNPKKISDIRPDGNGRRRTRVVQTAMGMGDDNDEVDYRLVYDIIVEDQ